MKVFLFYLIFSISSQSMHDHQSFMDYLRTEDAKKYTDFSLCSRSGKSYEVHRLIFGRNQYFKTIFNSSFLENHEKKINLNVSDKVLDIIYNFFYSDNCDKILDAQISLSEYIELLDFARRTENDLLMKNIKKQAKIKLDIDDNLYDNLNNLLAYEDVEIIEKILRVPLKAAGIKTMPDNLVFENSNEPNILNAHKNKVISVKFSPKNDKIISTSFDQTVKIFDAKTMKLLQTLQGHEGYVSYAEFSESQNLVITASRDGTAKIFNAQSGDLIHTLGDHKENVVLAYFTQDEKFAFTVTTDQVKRQWDVETGDLVLVSHILPLELKDLNDLLKSKYRLKWLYFRVILDEYILNFKDLKQCVDGFYQFIKDVPDLFQFIEENQQLRSYLRLAF